LIGVGGSSGGLSCEKPKEGGMAGGAVADQCRVAAAGASRARRGGAKRGSACGGLRLFHVHDCPLRCCFTILSCMGMDGPAHT
jgi:hypothetical protein